tara:strand:+ start:1001 stop:1156 length:156 start_codon:yes stop_codon:yes gene_type:complete
MYRALWRVLPGKTWAKVTQLVVFGLAVIAVLFVVVFPLISQLFVFEQSTLG